MEIIFQITPMKLSKFFSLINEDGPEQDSEGFLLVAGRGEPLRWVSRDSLANNTELKRVKASSFEQAFSELKHGYKIARDAWPEGQFVTLYYDKSHTALACVVCDGGPVGKWVPEHEDLFASDWISF